MKLGVAFNVFNGEELLLDAIKNVRNNADFICVIYQQESNNHKEKKDLSSLIKEIELLVDKTIEYKPNEDVLRWGLSDLQIQGVDEIFLGKHNNMMKYELGIKICRANNCSHFLLMDTDEFYIEEEVKRGKERVEQGGYDASFCQMQTYYKFNNCVIDPPEDYYVPFIYRLTPSSQISLIANEDFPVITDGSRRIRTKHPYIFPRKELQMHHFSYVRKDAKELLSKIETCPQYPLFTKERKEKIIADWKNFIIGKEVAWGIDQTFSTKEITPKISTIQLCE